MPKEKEEMFKPYTHTTTKTVKDIYGTSTPSIPEGWEAIDFRLARVGDVYLNSISQLHVVTATFNETEPDPRIILRKLEPISDKELLDCLIGWLWSNAPEHVADSFLTDKKVFKNREEFDKAILTRATELARKKKAKG